MHTTNLIVARQPANRLILIDKLQQYCKALECGLNLDASEAKMELGNITTCDVDVCFELYDPTASSDAGLFMSVDDCEIDGKHPWKKLEDRLEILQNVIRLCLLFTNCVEFFVTDQPGNIDSSISQVICAEDIIQVIYQKYTALSPWELVLPDIHLTIKNRQ